MAENQRLSSGCNYYLFFLLSRQAMFAGFYVVVAVHFSTCYFLISQGGFLQALSSMVIFINAFICVVFLIWDKNYRNRLKRFKNLLNDENLTSNVAFQPGEKTSLSAGTVLIASVSIASLVFAAALFVLFTIPYINNQL